MNITPTTRKAILIGASPSNQKTIPGVRQDVSAWKKFLDSNTGGAWQPDEIIDASSLGKNDLLRLIQSLKSCDYVFVAFSGHSSTVKTELPWTELELALDSGELILERELNPGCPRFTLILDSCRNHEFLTEGHTKSASLEQLTEEILKRDQSRQLFNDALLRAESGKVTIYSTGDNSSASDKEPFTQHMIFAAQNWAKNQLGIITLDQATQLGKESLNVRNPQQQPEYQGGRRRNHFPFAVSL